jgi:hypothetical protein
MPISYEEYVLAPETKRKARAKIPLVKDDKETSTYKEVLRWDGTEDKWYKLVLTHDGEKWRLLKKWGGKDAKGVDPEKGFGYAVKEYGEEEKAMKAYVAAKKQKFREGKYVLTAGEHEAKVKEECLEITEEFITYVVGETREALGEYFGGDLLAWSKFCVLLEEALEQGLIWEHVEKGFLRVE